MGFRVAVIFAVLHIPFNEAGKWRSLLRGETHGAGALVNSGAEMRSKANTGLRIMSKAEMMADMTVEKAYKKFMEMDHSHTNPKIMNLIQAKFDKASHGKSEPTGYAAVDGARDMLNDMMDKAIMSRDLESVKCYEFDIDQLKILKELEQDIAYVNAEASGAKSEVLRAEEVIHVVEEVKLPTNRQELDQHNEVCRINIATLKQQLAVVEADIAVMKNILGMVCADFVTTPEPSTPALLQLEANSSGGAGAIVKCVSCLTGHQIAWMRHAQLQPMLAALKSQVAKDYVQQNLLSEFDDTAHTSPSGVKSVFLQEGELGQNLPDEGIDIPALSSRFNISEAPTFSSPGSCNEQMTGENSSTYRGCQSKTLSGRECQKWSLQSPHAHNITSASEPNGGLGDHNYCRNPNGEETIWCYTMDAGTEWEYCQPMIALSAPTGVSKHDCIEANMCKLNKPDCGKLRDRFLVIMAGIMDKKKELSTALNQLERSCKEIKESYEATISSLESQLREEQTNLATATSVMTENQQQSGLSNEKHGTIDMEYHSEMQTCCDNRNSYTGEICALEKIRGELYKLEGLSVFITDCEVSDWIDEECSLSCGGGSQNRKRTIIMHPVNGTQCPPLKMERSCNVEGCPVDCKLAEWTGWSDCTAECGGGVMTRARAKEVEPLNGGLPCEEEEETQQCNSFACNQDCKLHEWSEWGLCSKLCDSGTSERTRDVKQAARGLGHCEDAESEDRLELRPCNTYDCQSLIPQGRTTLQCTEKLDVVIVLDGSGSLGSYGWRESKAMALKFIGALHGGENGANVGLLLFSGPADWSDFEACAGSNVNARPEPETCGVKWVKHLTGDLGSLETAAEQMDWPRRTTLTSLALAEASSELLNGRQDAPSVVIVITDGRPLSPLNTKEASAALKDKARLIYVPVGTGVKSSIKDMREWASHPWENNVLEIDTFAALDTPNTINKMISEFCTQMV